MGREMSQTVDGDSNRNAAEVGVSGAQGTAKIGDAEGKHSAQSGGRIHWRTLLQRRLLVRVTLPTAIGIIQLVMAIVAIARGDAPAIVLLVAVPALAVGYWFGRKTKMAWDNDRSEVTLIQAQVLLAASYILVRFGTHRFLERTLGDESWIAEAILLVSFGLFFGRSFGLAVQIWRAISAESTPKEGSRPG